MVLRTKNSVLLAKIESAEGTEETPSASTNAIFIENPNISHNVNLIDTNEVTGSLDSEGPIVGGMQVSVTFDAYLKGSGAAGTAPEIGPLLRACGWAETVTGTAVPSSAEACGAGGSTTTAELGTSASTTAQLYQGMPINFTSGVSGSSFIMDYTTGKIATLTDTLGGTINAGSNYQIPINVLYAPASTSIPSLTLYMYMDGLLYKVVGARGTFTFQLEAGGVGRFSFSFTGLHLSKSDVAVPTPTYDSSRPPVFKGGVMKYDRGAAAVNALSLDNGNTLAYPDNPNATEGYDPGQITARRLTGSIDPTETLVATRNIFSDFRAGTRKIIHARLGSTAGNQIGVTIPSAHARSYQPGDREGIAVTGVEFQCVGQDSGAFICFY